MVEGTGGPGRVPPPGGPPPTTGTPASAGSPTPAPSSSVPPIPVPSSTPPATAAGQTSTPVAASADLRRTRFSGVWVGVTVAAVILILLLTFILQNSRSVQISFFGATGQLPLGVALLMAAAGGVVLVAIPGYGRIIQLRRTVKRAGSTSPAQPTRTKQGPA
jgi:uncharacterized integral membrane protein